MPRHLTHQQTLLALFIIVLGGVLRFQGLQWDEMLLLHPDEGNLVRAASRISFPDRLVPDFDAYNGLSLYLPRLAAELVFDEASPANIGLAGRYLSAFASSLAIVAIGVAASLMAGRSAGLLALWMAAFSPALIQSAHFATTESGLVLAVAALIALTASYQANKLGFIRAAVAIGLVLGCALGLKTSAAAFAVIPFAATATAVSRVGWFRTVVAGLLSVAIAVTIALLSTPQILLDPKRYWAVMQFERAVVEGTIDVFWTYQFTHATSVVFELSQLPWLLDPMTAALALAGATALICSFALGGRRHMVRRSGPALLFGMVYAVIVFQWHAKFVRYLLPLVPVLIVLAAIAGRLAIATLRGTLRKTVTILILTFPLAAGLTQATLYQTEDARIQLWNWLSPKIVSGDTVAIEPRDVGPPFPTRSMVHPKIAVLPLLKPYDDAKIYAVAAILAKSDWMIISSRRHIGVLPRLTNRFPEMCGYYAALFGGALGYRRIRTFRRRGPLFGLFDMERLAEETFTVFDAPSTILLRNHDERTAQDIADQIRRRLRQRCH